MQLSMYSMFKDKLKIVPLTNLNEYLPCETSETQVNINITVVENSKKNSALIFVQQTFLCFNWNFNACASVWLFLPTYFVTGHSEDIALAAERIAWWRRLWRTENVSYFSPFILSLPIMAVITGRYMSKVINEYKIMYGVALVGKKIDTDVRYMLTSYVYIFWYM